MKMTAAGFAVLREAFGYLTKDQVSQIELIVGEIDADKSISYPQGAYILATVWHETGGKMQPVPEIGKGRTRAYGKWFKNSKGELYGWKNGAKREAYLQSECPHLFYGRGLPQLTWYDNYKKASEKLGVDFVNNPELALDMKLSTRILIVGMKEGWFTSHTLARHINQSKKDYTNARRIINGMDRATHIAGIAAIIERALRKP